MPEADAMLNYLDRMPCLSVLMALAASTQAPATVHSLYTYLHGHLAHVSNLLSLNVMRAGSMASLLQFYPEWLAHKRCLVSIRSRILNSWEESSSGFVVTQSWFYKTR